MFFIETCARGATTSSTRYDLIASITGDEEGVLLHLTDGTSIRGNRSRQCVLDDYNDMVAMYGPPQGIRGDAG